MVGTVRLAVPYRINRDEFTRIAIEISTSICEKWATESLNHFQKLGSRTMLEVPSNKVEVLWEAVDIKQHWVEIRFFVPASKAEKVAQKIQNQIWQQYGDELAHVAAEN